MKIAQVAPLWENIPPTYYGGTERIVSAITEGLVEAGHDVTLFACGTSHTNAHLVSVYPRPLFRDGIPWTNIMYPLLNITEAFDREAEFDLIHVHLNKASDYLSLPLARPIRHKVVFTLHFTYPTTQPNNADRHAVLQKYRDLQYISISNSQRDGGHDLNWVETVYNAVNVPDYEYTAVPGDHLFWLGKFNPDKGTKAAIQAAQSTHKPIKLAGTIDTLEGEDKRYYETEIKPHIDGKTVQFVGELDAAQKSKEYGAAKAFLNPIQWSEPFGLVMTEAMACGTPVISYANGAAPEIIEDGKTGFLVNEDSQSPKGDWIVKKSGVEGITEAIEKIYSMDTDTYARMRMASRARVEKSFAYPRMVHDYIKVYETVLAAHKR